MKPLHMFLMFLCLSIAATGCATSVELADVSTRCIALGEGQTASVWSFRISETRPTTVAAVSRNGTALAYTNFFGDGERQAVIIRRDGTIEAFEVEEKSSSTLPAAINDAEMVAGIFYQGSFAVQGDAYGFLRQSDGNVTSFDLPESAPAAYVTDMNERGDIIGTYGSTGSIQQSFIRFSDGRVQKIEVAGATDVRAMDITEAGEIIGTYWAEGDSERTIFRLTTAGDVSVIDRPEGKLITATGPDLLAMDTEDGPVIWRSGETELLDTVGASEDDVWIKAILADGTALGGTAGAGFLQPPGQPPAVFSIPDATWLSIADARPGFIVGNFAVDDSTLSNGYVLSTDSTCTPGA